MRYMLLLYDCTPPGPGEPGFEEALDRINAFAAECRERGVLVGADPLQPESVATTVKVENGRTLITDGPYAETHEHLGGYYVLDLDTLDDALELAARCPFAEYGAIEVRPVAIIPGVNQSVPAAAGGE
jgi:hypothetical protein